MFVCKTWLRFYLVIYNAKFDVMFSKVCPPFAMAATAQSGQYLFKPWRSGPSFFWTPSVNPFKVQIWPWTLEGGSHQPSRNTFKNKAINIWYILGPTSHLDTVTGKQKSPSWFATFCQPWTMNEIHINAVTQPLYFELDFTVFFFFFSLKVREPDLSSSIWDTGYQHEFHRGTLWKRWKHISSTE